MSLLKSLSRGSFFSDESLLQAREGYLPMAGSCTAETAFAHWTRRVAVQHELGIAREMAGLSDAALRGLAAEFERAPRRARTDPLRLCTPLGSVLILIGALWLVLANTLHWGAGNAVAWTEMAAAGCLALGAIGVSVGVLASFSNMSLEVGHGKVGLCTGLLDEQHPWLYKASLLARNPAADAYRQRVLQERGPLRGVDFLMMREIARADDSMQMTRVARAVAEQLNAGPAVRPLPADAAAAAADAAAAAAAAAVVAAETAGSASAVAALAAAALAAAAAAPAAPAESSADAETRPLAAVPSVAAAIEQATVDADGNTPLATSVRPFGATPAERRRQG